MGRGQIFRLEVFRIIGGENCLQFLNFAATYLLNEVIFNRQLQKPNYHKHLACLSLE